MRGVYYNEFDPKAAAWIRELIAAGEIAPGDVDERSITKVEPRELEGYRQCHFFAGIGGWSLALRIAGWPDDRPVWTGSCPCQPFSAGGRHKGVEDHRDLWPVFARLIGDSCPSVIFGEQSERSITFGWLDRLCDDLEARNYAIGSAVLPACSVGSGHERSRLWWVADSQHRGMEIGRGATPAVENSLGCERVLGSVESSLSIKAGTLVDQKRVAERDEWLSEPPTILLANGIPSSVGRLRGYGNAIVPRVAAEFIQAYTQAIR